MIILSHVAEQCSREYFTPLVFVFFLLCFCKLYYIYIYMMTVTEPYITISPTVSLDPEEPNGKAFSAPPKPPVC